MNALLKIATIANLVAEIGDCDELQFSLDGFVNVLTELKTCLNEPPVITKIDKCECCDSTAPATKVNGLYCCAECDNFDEEEEEETDLFAELCAKANSDTPEEEEDSIEPCKCKSSWDIRCLCCPVKEHKRFQNCPERFNLTYECIKNDFEKYRDIEASSNRQNKHTKIFQYAREEPFFLTDDNLEDELLYLIEQDEESEEEYLCYYCDTFVSNAEEQDEAEWNDDRLVCRSCICDHKCEECCEFFEEDDLEHIGDNLFCYDCKVPKKCEDLVEEVSEYINEMDDSDEKLEMLEKIKNIIAEYKK